MRKTYLLLKADGGLTVRKAMPLSAMQKFVEGYIEKVGMVYCNEDGLRLNLPINKSIPFFRGNIIIEAIEA